ncbi:MAG: PadR family transcriptional regulator [Anaerolineaceae bacterium]|jgi:DNA-binding PadR family transcriptional regulator|nr:MAG: PadR family transcriptional regulator [Anaerolineaceae bacterium]
MNIHNMNIRSIHIIILGILYDGPKHGYQIHKCLDDPNGIGAVWKIKITNIYGLLDVLEKDGYIVPSKQLIDDTTYPPKKYFEITDRGKEIFQQWMREPVKHGREIRQVFLSKLYFANKESAEVAHQLILDQIKECNQWLVNSKQLPDGGVEFVKIVNSFRLMQMKSYITWLEELKKK